MILQPWLTQLCRMIPNVHSALVFDSQNITAQSIPAATWPKTDFDYKKVSQAYALLKAQTGPVIILGKHNEEPNAANSTERTTDNIIIACPLVLKQTSGFVMLDINAKHTQQNAILQILNWAKDWLALLLEHDSQAVNINDDNFFSQNSRGASSKNEVLTRHIEIVKLILNCNAQYEANLTLVSEVANAYGFSRVCLGEVNHNHMDVKALSNTASFDARSNYIKCIQGLMYEAKHSTSPQSYHRDPVDDEEHSLNSNSMLNRVLSAHDNQAVLLCPLRMNDQTFGVLLCESAQNIPKVLHVELMSLLDFLTPILALKQQVNKPILQQLKSRFTKGCETLFKGKIAGFPLLMASLLMVVLLASVLNGDHRISASASLEGHILRAVVAPFDSYIKHAYIRAGEEVSENQLIAQLDDQELTLEQKRLLSQKEALDKQYRKELVALNQSQVRIIKTQIAQVDIQLNLLKSKHQRTRLLSPLNGIIVEGDLSRSIGSPVKQGQVLFEVAPLNDFRLVLKVDERDIPFLKVGQEGHLLLKAYPNKPITFRLKQVAMVYQQEEERIWYRTEASLMDSDISLRPGMEGLAKVVVGEQSYLYLAFHRTLDWLRLKLWSWIP